MRGVAADENASITKAVGDQSTPNPVLFRNDLIFEIRSDAEDRPDGPVPID